MKKPAKRSVKVAEKNPPKKPKGLPAHLTPGNPGNSGGKPGRSGRKPDEFKALCRKYGYKAVVRMAKNIIPKHEHPHFMSASKLLIEQGYGKPKENIEHSASESLIGLLAGSFK